MEVHLMSQSPVEPLPAPEGIYQAKEGDWEKLISQAAGQVQTKMLKMFEVKAKEMANRVKKRRTKRALNKKYTK
jgi:hypothetical protein